LRGEAGPDAVRRDQAGSSARRKKSGERAVEAIGAARFFEGRRRGYGHAESDSLANDQRRRAVSRPDARGGGGDAAVSRSAGGSRAAPRPPPRRVAPNTSVVPWWAWR